MTSEHRLRAELKATAAGFEWFFGEREVQWWASRAVWGWPVVRRRLRLWRPARGGGPPPTNDERLRVLGPRGQR